jgi:hypothetical protein
MKITTLVFIVAAMPVAAFADGAFDGVYDGNMAFLKAESNGRGCTGTYRRRVTIHNNAFIIVYNEAHGISLAGIVDGNGFVNAFANSEGGGVRLQGKISEGKLGGQIGSAYCTYTLDLTKVGTR